MAELNRKELERHFNDLLKPFLYKDYGPNGLQIEGKTMIKKVAFAVSATADTVAQTCRLGADALVVHHGLFWKFHGARTITGPFAKRVHPLIKNDVNLFGYHLPLDGNAEVGNAASLASFIGLGELEPFGLYEGMPTGVKGALKQALAAKELKYKLETVLKHTVILSSPDESQLVKRVGIITGGANAEWKEAARADLDAYITGEMSEHDWNEAKECGVHMFAGGHHATERFGIQSLMKSVQTKFGVECIFIDSDNPA